MFLISLMDILVSPKKEMVRSKKVSMALPEISEF
jgi:hypothetical protein